MCGHIASLPPVTTGVLSKKLRFPLSQQGSYVNMNDLNQSETTATCKVVSCTELRIMIAFTAHGAVACTENVRQRITDAESGYSKG
jgi:hypothetical protein